MWRREIANAEPYFFLRTSILASSFDPLELTHKRVNFKLRIDRGEIHAVNDQ